MPSRRAFGTSVALHLMAILAILFPLNFPGTRRPGAPMMAAAAEHYGESFGGTYDGVILWPKEERHTRLVPPLPAMRPNLFSEKDPKPLSIPFYGVYWFFKQPGSQPPPNSLVARGSPLEMIFRSTDFRPLVMDAHQNFGKRIDIRCCREIQIAIANAEPHADSVTVELVLLDTKTSGTQSLGRAPVTSTQAEFLTFKIPATPTIAHFDEVAVRFHLARFRHTSSARISIERFLLVPRR